MSAEGVRVSPEWLLLREPVDAAARSAELAERVGRHLATASRLVIHDLGGGSGAMGRWLAPRLPGPQHWVVHDRDADLLKLAVGGPGPAPTGPRHRRGEAIRHHPAGAGGSRRREPLRRLGAARPADRGRAGPDARRLYRHRASADAARADGRRSGHRDPGGSPGRAHGRRLQCPPTTRDDGGPRLGPTPSRPPSVSSAARAPRSSSGRAPGDSMRPTPTWRRVVRRVVAAACAGARAGRRGRRLPRPAPGAGGRRGSPSSSMPTCWCCRDDRRRRRARTWSMGPWWWVHLAAAAATLAVLVWRLGTGRSSTACARSTAGRWRRQAWPCSTTVLRLALEDRSPRPRRRPAAGYGDRRVLPLASSTSPCPAGWWATSTAGSATAVTRATSAAGCGRWRGRSAGQVVQVVLTLAVLLVLPSPVRAVVPLVALALVAAAAGVALAARVRPAVGRSRWARLRSAAARDLRDALLARRAWPAIALASALAVAGHAATFLIAARSAGVTAPPSRYCRWRCS